MTEEVFESVNEKSAIGKKKKKKKSRGEANGIQQNT